MVSDPKRNKQTVKWYLKPASVLVAIVVVGPLAIPMIWASPALKRWQKITLTAIVILLTAWMIKASIDLYNILLRELRNIEEALK